MLKKILFSFLFLSLTSSAYPSTVNVMDTPTAKIIEYGSYEVDFKLFREGGVVPKLFFGVFNFLNLGISWEIQRFLGDLQAKPAVPALHARIQIYAGNMAFPAVAFGYDGQGYIHKVDEANDRYHQEPKGIYFVIGREMFAPGVFMNAGINSNTLRDGEVYGFVNMTVELGSESFLFMSEIDNINVLPETRINFGLRIVLSEDVIVDLMIRDCWGSRDEPLFPNDRMLSLSYKGQF